MSSVERPGLSSVEVSAPVRADKISSPAPSNPQPQDPRQLRGMINELETKFGDMLPGGGR